MTVRVGLTGGIASGKSTVSALFADLGAVVIDSDVLAREVVARGTPGLERVVAEFGTSLLTSEGDLDRPAMAALVFGDEAARKRLEAIIHPLVRERVVALEEAAGALAGATDSLGQALTDEAILSVELSGEHAPQDWLSDGRLGALVGVELPGRAGEIDLEGGRVRVLTLVPLRPSELAVVRAEAGAGRRRIAEALAGQGW